MYSEMISIFNGRRRTLGASATSTIYAQVSVQLRSYLHEFKDSTFIVFMAICLHADENGESWPSQETLMRETGKGRDAIRNALAFLREMTINGDRVMVSHQQANNNGTFGSNRYLIFPTPEEIAFIAGQPMLSEPMSPQPMSPQPTSAEAPTKYNHLKEEPIQRRTSVQRKTGKPTGSVEAIACFDTVPLMVDPPLAGDTNHLPLHEIARAECLPSGERDNRDDRETEPSEPSEAELYSLDRAFNAGKFGDEDTYRFNALAFDKYRDHYRTLHLSGYTGREVKQGASEMACGANKYSKLAMVTPKALAAEIKSFLTSAQPGPKGTGTVRQFSQEDEI